MDERRRKAICAVSDLLTLHTDSIYALFGVAEAEAAVKEKVARAFQEARKDGSLTKLQNLVRSNLEILRNTPMLAEAVGLETEKLLPGVRVARKEADVSSLLYAYKQAIPAGAVQKEIRAALGAIYKKRTRAFLSEQRYLEACVELRMASINGGVPPKVLLSSWKIFEEAINLVSQSVHPAPEGAFEATQDAIYHLREYRLSSALVLALLRRSLVVYLYSMSEDDPELLKRAVKTVHSVVRESPKAGDKECPIDKDLRDRGIQLLVELLEQP